MLVTPEMALQAAQKYFDINLSGATSVEQVEPFYGNFSIDILQDGQTVGMLSVNDFNGQVFQHGWHDTFIEASEY